MRTHTELRIVKHTLSERRLEERLFLNKQHKVFIHILFCAPFWSPTLASEGLYGAFCSSVYLCTFYRLKFEPSLLMRTWHRGQILTSFLFFKHPSINPFLPWWALNYKRSSG